MSRFGGGIPGGVAVVVGAFLCGGLVSTSFFLLRPFGGKRDSKGADERLDPGRDAGQHASPDGVCLVSDEGTDLKERNRRGDVRYARQRLVLGHDGQRALRSGSCLVIGCGGLASGCVPLLVGAGIARLGLVDADVVEESNLHRQTIHSTETVGMHKVDSAQLFVQKLNPNVEVTVYRVPRSFQKEKISFLRCRQVICAASWSYFRFARAPARPCKRRSQRTGTWSSSYINAAAKQTGRREHFPAVVTLGKRFPHAKGLGVFDPPDPGVSASCWFLRR